MGTDRLPLQLGLLAVIGALLLMPAVPRTHRPDRARVQADAVAAALEVEAAAVVHRLGPVAARLREGEVVDWKEFARLTAASESPAMAVAEDSSVYAWLPWVPAAARASYESRTGRDGYRSFRLVEPDGDSASPAAQRREHLPVHLAAPVETGGPLLGLDLAADDELRTAADRARKSGEPQLLGPRRLLAPNAGRCTSAMGAAMCQPALTLLIPVRGARGATPPGVLLAIVPWTRIESAASQRLAQSLGTTNVLAADAWVQPSGRRPAPPALLLSSTARSAFYVGDRLWTVELRLPGLSARARRSK